MTAQSKLFKNSILIIGFSIFLVLFISYAKGKFNHQTSFRIQSNLASELRPGIKVTYKGFRVGQLSKMALDSKGEVEAEIQADTEYLSLFREGVKLKISKDKIVTTELVLMDVNSESPLLTTDLVIPVYKDDVAADLSKKIEPLLTKFNTLLEQLSDPKIGVVSSLNQSRQAIHETTKFVTLISNKDNGLPAVLSETQHTMLNLQPVAVQAEFTLKELRSTIVTLDKTLQATKTLIQDINNPDTGIKPTLEQVQSVSSSTKSLILNLDQTVSDLTSAPVYKFLIPKKE
jgi:ABC-type transporter Mla subunit MlaD